jgi:hypothetical protein
MFAALMNGVLILFSLAARFFCWGILIWAIGFSILYWVSHRGDRKMSSRQFTILTLVMMVIAGIAIPLLAFRFVPDLISPIGILEGRPRSIGWLLAVEIPVLIMLIVSILRLFKWKDPQNDWETGNKLD